MKNKIILKLFACIPLLLFSLNTWANEDGITAKGEPGPMEWALTNIVFIIAGMAIVGAFLAIFNLFNKLLAIQKLRFMQEHGIVTQESFEAVEKESWWSRFYENMTKAIPIEKEKDAMLDHDYDGIKELDNVLPPWWVATFYVSIVYAFLHIGYWHFSDYGYSSAEEYNMNMEAAEKSVKAYLASRSDMVDETSVEMLADETQIAIGGAIFETKCTPCHGLKGEGNSIGPNLTDQYWIHGPDIKTIFKTIKYGVPEKGMISWKSQLRPGDIQKVSSYILSLQGTNPPNAKEPQGDLYETNEPADKIGMK